MNYEPNMPEGLSPAQATETLVSAYVLLTGDTGITDETWVTERVNLYYLFLEDRNARQQKEVDEIVDCLREYFTHIWHHS